MKIHFHGHFSFFQGNYFIFLQFFDCTVQGFDGNSTFLIELLAGFLDRHLAFFSDIIGGSVFEDIIQQDKMGRIVPLFQPPGAENECLFRSSPRNLFL